MFRQRYRTSMPLMSAQCDSDSDSIQLYLPTYLQIDTYIQMLKKIKNKLNKTFFAYVL